MMYKKYLDDPKNTSRIGSIMSPSMHKVSEFLMRSEDRTKFDSLIAELEVFKHKKQDPLGICLDFEPYKLCFEELWQEFTTDIKKFASLQIGTTANCGFLSSDR